jgi:hypothetical protein
MADSQSDRQAKKRAQENERSERGERARGESPREKNIAVEKTRAGEAPALELAEEVATAGRAGERNLRIEWIDVWIGNNKPCCFNVVTLPENQLEVELEQAAYKKKYSGGGALKTDVTPVVPIGTRGKLIARDLTTGEVLEQTWVWRNLGGASFFGWLVTAVRKLFGA